MTFDWKTEFHRYRRYFTDIRRFYQQKKARIYTEVVLSIATVAFLVFFAIKPTLVTIAGLVKELDDKKVVTQRLEEKINNLNIAQKEYFNIQENLEFIEQALPKDSRVFILVKQFEALAVQTGVSLIAAQYSPVNLKGDDGSGNVQSVGVKMVLIGDYQNLKKFLFSLSNFRRIFRIEGFSFELQEKSGELVLSVDGKVFFLGGKK